MTHDWIHRCARNPVLRSLLFFSGIAALAWSFSRSAPAPRFGALRGALLGTGGSEGNKKLGDHLEFEVLQDERDTSPPALKLTGFEVTAQSSLRPLELQVVRDEVGRQIRLRAFASIDALFPLRSGPAKLLFVVAGAGVDLDAKPPRSLGELEARNDVRCFLEQVEVPHRPLDAQLLNFERLEQRKNVLLPIFTKDTRPRVRVRAAKVQDWTLQVRAADGVRTPLETTGREPAPYILLDVQAIELKPADGPLILELLYDGGVVAEWPIDHSPTKKEYESNSAPDTSEYHRGWHQYYAKNAEGRKYYDSGENASAWKLWDETRLLAERLGSPTEVAGRYRSLAYIDLQNDAFDRAQVELAHARELSVSTADIIGLARVEYLEALLHERRAGPNGAMLAKKRYTQAIEMALANGDDYDANMFALLLASVLAEYGNAGDARSWLKSIGEKQTGRAGIDHAVHRIYVERVAYERGDGHTDAKVLRDDAQAVLDRLGKDEDSRPGDFAHLLLSLIRYDLELGDLDAADARAENLAAIPEDGIGYARYYRPLLLAEVHIARGRHDRARSELLNFQQRLGNRKDGAAMSARSAIDALLGLIFFRERKMRAAEAMFVRTIAGVERHARDLSSPRARARHRIQFQYAEQSLLEILLDRDDLGRAFELTEQIRLRELLDLATEAEIGQAPKAFDDYVRDYFELQKLYPSDCEKSTRQEAVECHNRRAAIDVELDEMHRKFWAERLDPGRVNDFRALDILRSSNIPGSAVLSVADLSRGRKASFWVEEGKVRAAVLGSGEDPIKPWLGDLARVKRVLVAPNQPSTYSLPMRKLEGGMFLGAKIPVLMLAYAEPQRRRGTRLERPLIIADPENNLLHAGDEGRELSKRWPNAVFLNGENATRAGVLSSWNADILHFAGHAELIAEDMWRPTLRLAGGETISLEDVLAAPPNASLVVLNACGSGAFLERGHIGLPDAFARTADYVLASSTRVLDDAHARAFVADFYAAGVADPPEAYRRALDAAALRGENNVDFRLWVSVGGRK